MTSEEKGKDARDALNANQKLLHDQREANAKMVNATIRAHEATDEAEAARARAEALTNALRESEERYRTLFDLSPTAVYSCDTSGVIQHFNRHAAELWGREPAAGDTDERFCGSYKMFRPDGSFMPHDQCPMAEVLSGKLSEARDAEVTIERPDGSRIVAIVNIHPIKDQRGAVTAAINCFYDITARKQAENDLAASLSRERELAEFRELFVGIVSHDLRNPLASITMGAAVLLRRGRLDEQDERGVGRIASNSDRMTQMIAQLLDLTRARLGGGFPIELGPTDLREVCRSVIEEFGGAIRLDATGDLSGTWDANRLAEALSNIVGNAIEHAAPDTHVAVKAHAEGAAVVVEIINQGDPIPPDVLPFIFEPFRRARQHEKPKSGNLGLGLYIAHEIARSHGGTLDAHSVDGKTTFVMCLPHGTPHADSSS